MNEQHRQMITAQRQLDADAATRRQQNRETNLQLRQEFHASVNLDNIDANFTDNQLAIIHGNPVTLSPEDRQIESDYLGLTCVLLANVPSENDMVLWCGGYHSITALNVFRNNTRQQIERDQERGVARSTSPFLHPTTRQVLTEQVFYHGEVELTAAQKAVVQRKIRKYNRGDFQQRLQAFQEYQRLHDRYQQLLSLQRNQANAAPVNPMLPENPDDPNSDDDQSLTRRLQQILDGDNDNQNDEDDDSSDDSSLGMPSLGNPNARGRGLVDRAASRLNNNASGQGNV